MSRSQIQKQVLSLYKECLRAAEMKNRQFKSVVRSDFKRNAKAIQRSDTMRIEYLVRQGQRRLEMMKVSVHVYAFTIRMCACVCILCMHIMHACGMRA